MDQVAISTAYYYREQEKRESQATKAERFHISSYTTPSGKSRTSDPKIKKSPARAVPWDKGKEAAKQFVWLRQPEEGGRRRCGSASVPSHASSPNKLQSWLNWCLFKIAQSSNKS